MIIEISFFTTQSDINQTKHEAWYALHKCTHAHCPHGCEHPQPFIAFENLYCGRCFYKEELHTLMIPCNEEHC